MILIKINSKNQYTSTQRINLAYKALQLGADFQKICSFLSWQEFEEISAKTLEANDFEVKKRFRFVSNTRKWEIDVIGLYKPLLLCIDCKNWKYNWSKSSIKKAVQAQKDRVKALIVILNDNKILKIMKITTWEKVLLVPIILSLIPSSSKFYKKTAVVPIFQFQNFLRELYVNIEKIAYWKWEKDKNCLKSF